VNTLAALAAPAVGAAFGYGAQRGAFCMNSGFRAVLEGDTTKVNALGLAIAVQLLLLPMIFASGLARPARLPLPLVAAVAGGVLFGVSLRWAGGCAAGIWYKLGAGDMGAVPAILGMAIGAVAAEAGPLSSVRVPLQQAVPDLFSWTPHPGVSVVLGLLLLAALSRLAPGRAGAWDWRLTGVVVGAVAALAWPASALAGRAFGLAAIPGSADVIAVAAGARLPSWDLWLVLGIAAGGWLGARRGGAVAFRAPGPAALIQRLAGGFGLGVGASIATGCTVGQGLTGLALLAPSSAVIMASIFAGSALTTAIARRRQGTASHAATPAASLE
jgi:uncharacterized membrane protein YedE/YeeE